MDADRKTRIFERLQKSMNEAGLSSPEATSLICPLCWQPTAFDDLSIEHVIPSSVGGRSVTLTCTSCNNALGSSLDAHLARYQSVADALKGHGTIPGKMCVFGEQVTVNMTLGPPSAGKHIAVVGRASNPAASDAIKQEFEKGNVEPLEITLNFGYIKNQFQTALLRAAYLVLFRIFEYEYAKHDIVQAIRRRIVDPSLDTPDLGTLIGELRNSTIPVDNDYFVIRGFMDDIPFFMVVIRLKRETETSQFVIMPVPHRKSDQFFTIAAKVAGENPIMLFKNIPPQAIFIDVERKTDSP